MNTKWSKNGDLHVLKDEDTGIQLAMAAKSPVTDRWFFLLEPDEEVGRSPRNSSNEGLYFDSWQSARIEGKAAFNAETEKALKRKAEEEARVAEEAAKADPE